MDPSEDPRVLKSLDSLGDSRSGAAGSLGDPLIAGEAEAAFAVVEGPEQRFEHGQ
jgi:hypothetical protein